MRRCLLVLTLASCVLAGCGGSGNSVPKVAAKVGNIEISTKRVERYIAYQAAEAKRRKETDFPVLGGVDYPELWKETVQQFVVWAEYQLKASQLGLSYSDATYRRRLANCCTGHAAGFVDAKAEEVRGEILRELLWSYAARNVSVTDGQVRAWYDSHRGSTYAGQTFEQTRKKARADLLEGMRGRAFLTLEEALKRHYAPQVSITKRKFKISP